MSMNFAGIGASIGIKDAGATKTLGSISGMISDLSSNLGGLASKAAGGLLMGFTGAKPIMETADALANIGNSVTNLTTSFEAQAQAHSVSTRKTLGQLGIFGKELDKTNAQAAGMAMGMKISDQAASHAAASMSQYGAELKAFGVDSAVTAAKLEDGMNVQMIDLGKHVRQLKNEFKYSDKELGDFAKMLTGTGEAIHDMQGPMQALPEWLELARQRANLAATGMSKIGGPEVMKSLAAATQKLFNLGVDGKTAQIVAIGLEKKMGGAMKSFQNMFAGTEADLHPFLESFSIVSGDIQKAFQAAQNGPEAFIDSMAGVVAKLRSGPNGVQKVAEFMKMFSGQMEKALGPDVAAGLEAAIRSVDDTKLKMLKTTKLVGKDLKTIANDVWRSSMTLQESFDMAMGAGESGFRSIGRQAAVTFVKEIPGAWAVFNKEAKALVAKGGTLGAIVEKMSEVSSLGAIAFVPKQYQPAVAIFGKIYSSVSPALGAVSQMSSALMGLLNPVTLISAAIGGFTALVVSNKTEGVSWGTAIEKATDQVKVFVGQWTDKILKWADEFDWDAVTKLLAEGLSSAFEGLTKVIGSLTGNLTEEATKDAGKLSFASVGTKIYTSFKNAFAKFDWEKIFNNLWASMQTFKGAAMGKINSFIKDVFGGIDDSTWSSIGASVGKGMKFALGSAWAILKNDQELIGQVNDIFMSLLWGAIKALPSVIGGMMGEIRKSISFPGGNIIQALFFPGDWLGGIAVDLGKLAMLVSLKIEALWADVKGKAEGIWAAMWMNSTIPDMVASGIEHIKTYAWGLIADFEKIGQKIGDIFSGAFSKVVGLFANGSTSPSGAIAGDMTLSTDTIKKAVDEMKVYIQKVLFESVTETISKSFSEAFTRMIKATMEFGDKDLKIFKDFADKVADRFRQMWITVLDETDKSVKAMGATIASSLNDIHKLELAMEKLESAREAVKRNEQEQNKPSDTDMVHAIHKPDWYWQGSGSFKDLFERKMDRLIEATSRSGTSSSPNADAAARQAATLRTAARPGTAGPASANTSANPRPGSGAGPSR